MPDIVAASSSLARCGQCGYWLTGLPPTGHCPECGAAYDDKQVILWGWGRGSHGGLTRSRGRPLFWLILIQLIVLRPDLQRTIRRAMTLDPTSCAFLLGLLGALFSSFLSRWERLAAETVSVRLSFAGVKQNPLKSHWGLSGIVLALSCALIFVTLFRVVPLPPAFLTIPLIIIVGFVVLVLMVRRASRREQFTPWTELRKFDLRGEKGGRYVLRIDANPTWWRAPDVVHADFDLSDQQAAALRQKIESSWQPLAT